MDNLWKLLPAEYALAHAILPTGHRNGTVLMAAAVEPDINLLNELQLLFDRQIEIELWSRQEAPGSDPGKIPAQAGAVARG